MNGRIAVQKTIGSQCATAHGAALNRFAGCALSLALLLCAIVLFALAHPNFFNARGFPVLAYIAYVPVFLLARKAPWKFVWLFGLAFGFGAYSFYAYWLSTFHPMGLIVIAGLFALEFALVFPALKAASVLFPRKGWLVQWLVWLAYEYLKTTGFTGFHYGIAAYTHWRWTRLIQIADITGIWGLNALIVFTSAWFSQTLVDARRMYGSSAACALSFTTVCRSLCDAARLHRVSAAVWFVCFCGVLAYGFIAPVDYSQSPTVKAALIQPNSDPWLGGIPAIRKDLDTLISLTERARAEHGGVELVVWPETAFVPRITMHYQRRNDRDRYELVEKLLTYIDGARADFVLGNGHAEQGYTREGKLDMLDYNSALLFSPKKNVFPPEPVVYKKTHLVPFTEYFPFEKRFPALYEKLLNGDTHMWEPGKEPVVFGAAGIRFGTPICFEDTFGYIARRFVQNGAQAIVNLSNDAWSKSVSCQYQHLSMAVFRSVENRVPTARSTASGQTAFIDPNGKIIAMAEPFVETYLVVDIPKRENAPGTRYTTWGDWFGAVSVFAALAALAAGIASRWVCAMRKKRI